MDDIPQDLLHEDDVTLNFFYWGFLLLYGQKEWGELWQLGATHVGQQRIQSGHASELFTKGVQNVGSVCLTSLWGIAMTLAMLENAACSSLKNWIAMGIFITSCGGRGLGLDLRIKNNLETPSSMF